jgi:gluconate kinase
MIVYCYDLLLFGYPGIGKDFCANRLSKLLGCLNIDADTYLTDEERAKLKNGTFTSDDRLAKLKRICDDLSDKLAKNKDITIGDSLPNHAARQFIIDYFGDNVKMILVKSSSATHKKHIGERQDRFSLLRIYCRTTSITTGNL